MVFGRFGFIRSRSWLAFCLILLCGSQFKAWAQQDAASSPAGSTVPALPVPQAAAGSAQPDGDSTKTAQSGAAGGAVTPSKESSLQKLGPGDLIEVGVYNVPELATKARVGNSGDVYLPLIDYVHVGDLTVDQAQAVIEKRLDDGGLVRNAHVTVVVAESTQGVTVIGEVAKPGIYPAVGDRKLYDLISAAGRSEERRVGK